MSEKLDRVMADYARIMLLAERLDRAADAAQACYLCHPLPTLDVRAAARYLRQLAALEAKLLPLAVRSVVKATLPESEVQP